VGSELIGRDAERERFDAVLDHLQDRSGALVVVGDPGITDDGEKKPVKQSVDSRQPERVESA
jgi:hypothetical protein